jgi:hypothetical protein
VSSKIRILAALALVVALPGCFDLIDATDELTWRPSGGAHLKRTLHLGVPPATAEATAAKIQEAGELEQIDLARVEAWRKVVKSFEVKATAEGKVLTVVEDLEIEPGMVGSLSPVQAEIGKKVKLDDASFPYSPSFAFEKLPNGNVKFQASLGDVKPPVTFDKESAPAVFGERLYTLRLQGPSIATAAPATATIKGGTVEWTTKLADIAGEQVKDDLLAEIGQPFSPLPLALGVLALVVLGAAFFTRQTRLKAEEARMEARMRPPAPRVMPEVMESGPVPQVGSEDATLSDASEINVDTEEDVPAAPINTAQAAAAGVVKFKCPSCKVELKVPLHLAGRQGKCRKCGGAFVSPVPGQLKQVRAAVAKGPAVEAASLRDAFSVKKVRCPCGVTSAVLKGRGEGEERCPACNQVLVVA